MGFLAKHGRQILLGLILSLFGCGSAVDSGVESAPSESSTPSGPVHLANFDVLVDPSEGMQFFTGVSAAGQIAEKLFLTSEPEFLADTAVAVTLGAGFNVPVFDYGSNTIFAFGNYAGLEDPCLVNTTGQNAHNMRLQLYQFTDSNVIVGTGGQSRSGKYEVDFQEVPNGVNTCRTFALTNTSAVSYRAKAAFVADSLDAVPVAAYINSVNNAPNRQVPVAYSTLALGSGFGGFLINAGVAKTRSYGDTLFDLDTAHSTVMRFTDYEIRSSGQYFPITEGFLEVTTQANGVVKGPYLISRAGLKADVQLASGAGSRTGTFWWRVCNSGCQVTLFEEPCFASTDMESIQGITLSDSSWKTLYMSYLTGGAVGSNRTVELIFDYNGNSRLDPGDKGYVFSNSVTVSAGTQTTLAATTLSQTVGACPF